MCVCERETESVFKVLYYSNTVIQGIISSEM